ncbi:e5924fdb-46b9-4bda-955d-7ddc22050c8f [Thermothielavioides terrestris]|uniref:E5924fdb-46b9-4bda-955d-7ddc22050c8f n=1 Tax=Thermothielavioides terrestris TaxID=2587410 RepID=A0A3S5CXN5_9PEZI|nr:e5924fdb-46b9-4bda-955d-7ddc22050c8f [Thermothielavioides terrestris]
MNGPPPPQEPLVSDIITAALTSLPSPAPSLPNPLFPVAVGSKPSNPPPTLDRTGINRIALYRGCFNPPHAGHLQLLETVLHRGGGMPTINVRAAVVLPLRDAAVAPKDRSLVFPLAVRARAWRDAIADSGVLAGRVCVLPSGSGSDYGSGSNSGVGEDAEGDLGFEWVAEFTRRVEELARREGCEDEEGRRVLWRIGGCGEWRELEGPHEVWECSVFDGSEEEWDGTEHGRLKYWFMPRDKQEEQFSSTDIREIVNTHRRRTVRLAARLTGYALSPRLLVEYLRQVARRK